MNDDSLQCMPGRYFIETLNDIARSEGNFDWHVAHHPYPENLGNPRTWEDKTASMSGDTLRITFKNVEVLPAYLKQDHLRFNNVPRRIILSEQGFHKRDGAAAEKEQAAAYAYAFYRVQHTPGIDAFILHRHVDHPNEGGLRLGLRESGNSHGTQIGPKRAIYDVFRDADTDRWSAAFEFALPVIGIERWEQTLSNESSAQPKARVPLLPGIPGKRPV